jgi:peptidoglycan/xylan/chitin deacetylase (PgdA/CDA1 family)
MQTGTESNSSRSRGALALSAALLALLAGAVVAIVFGSSNGASAAAKSTQSFDQSVKTAQFKVTGVDELLPQSPHRRVCWQFNVKHDGSTREWCAERKAGSSKWKLSSGVHGAKIAVDGGAATLSFDPAQVKISPGLYKWHFLVTACAAAGASGATGDAAIACDRRIPKTGGQTIRIRPLVPSSCKVKGPAQVRTGPRKGKRVALTFDDGPAPITPRFLKTLKHLDVKATFFMIGQQVGGQGALLKRMMRDGHELANHSWNHANLGGGGPGATAQIVNTNNAIKRASGFRPCVMRPPYGSTSAKLVSRVRAQKMTSILWDVDPLDWRRPGTGTIISTISRQTRAGSIILEHDGGGPRDQTLAAIPEYVRTLKARGYKFVTVSELLGYKTTYKLAPK